MPVGRKATILDDPDAEAKRLKHNAYHREYRKRTAEIQAKVKEYNAKYRERPEFQEWLKNYQKEYHQRAEVKKRSAERAKLRYWNNDDAREAKLRYARERYNNDPIYRERIRKQHGEWVERHKN